MLYRYLDEQWVRDFQENRRLRIAPVTTYRVTGDAREDTHEGVRETLITAPGSFNRQELKDALDTEGTLTISVGGSLKHNLHLPGGFLLCTSMRFGSDLMERFRVDSFFVITDPRVFAHAIRRAVAEHVSCHSCVHKRVTYVADIVKTLTPDDVKSQGRDFRVARLEDYFQKPRIPYMKEAEYRFLLPTEAAPMEPLSVTLTQDEIGSSCTFR